MADPGVVAAVRRYSRKYGVDPNAALAIGRVEGGLRRDARGDYMGGRHTSFGPFQLHEGGALPRGRSSSWAGSDAGIEYAIRQMARSGARGLRGQAAVSSIARNFERPADPNAEIRKALGYYKNVGTLPGSMTSGAGAGSMGLDPQTAPNQRQSLLKYVMANNVAYSQGQLPYSPTDFLQEAAQSPSLSSYALGPGNQGLPAAITRRGLVALSKGADRPGARTNQKILGFANQVASVFGAPLTIGTGTNHSQYTVNGNVSDHWSGNAADIPAEGKKLLKMGQSALIAAGANPAWAHKQNGGLYNIGGHQVIFRTTEGGNHWNHLHISAK